MYQEMQDSIGLVQAFDPEVAAAMSRELTRQRQNIELIASENIVSPAVMAAMGSVLTNKYAEGLPGKRYYGGCVYVDQVENIAIERACRLSGGRARKEERMRTAACWSSTALRRPRARPASRRSISASTELSSSGIQ